jgi:hypothetical protein
LHILQNVVDGAVLVGGFLIKKAGFKVPKICIGGIKSKACFDFAGSIQLKELPGNFFGRFFDPGFNP